MTDMEQPDLTSLTVELLSAYVANNTVASNELADLIETTRNALAGKISPAAEPVPEFVPAVSIRKSTASRDYILSLIDGKPYKSLKRHLASHGMTPADYRERYKLAKDYPMVAPGYSETRREVAQRLGLGRRREEASKPDATELTAPEPETAAAESPAAAPEKPSRRKAQAKGERSNSETAVLPREDGAPTATAEESAPQEAAVSADESAGAKAPRRKRLGVAFGSNEAAPEGNAGQSRPSAKASKPRKPKAMSAEATNPEQEAADAQPASAADGEKPRRGRPRKARPAKATAPASADNA